MARKFEEQKAKPTNDAYTGMLAVSFIALLVGCALLYLDYDQYQNKPPTPMDPTVKTRPAVDKIEAPGKKDTGEPKDTGEGKETEKETKDTKETDK